jgi:hypothetical protein
MDEKPILKPAAKASSFGCLTVCLLAVALFVVFTILYLLAGGSIGWWNPFYS